MFEHMKKKSRTSGSDDLVNKEYEGKERLLRRYGHVVRMNSERLANRLRYARIFRGSPRGDQEIDARLDTVMGNCKDQEKAQDSFFQASSWTSACDSSWKRLTFGVMIIIIILESHWFELQAWPAKIEINGDIWWVGCRGGLLQRKDNESSMVSQVNQRYEGCMDGATDPDSATTGAELVKGPPGKEKGYNAAKLSIWGPEQFIYVSKSCRYATGRLLICKNFVHWKTVCYLP